MFVTHSLLSQHEYGLQQRLTHLIHTDNNKYYCNASICVERYNSGTLK